VTTWFPEVIEEAVIWAGPATVTMLNGIYHKAENMKYLSSTDHEYNRIFGVQIIY
jgi:hypothetical protein